MTLRDYTLKPIIATLTYNKAYQYFNKRCYIYPRYIKLNNTFVKIDPNDFPARGSVEVSLSDGNESADELFERFGPLVTIRFNKDLSERLFEDDNQPLNRYFMKYMPSLGKLDSPIWIDEFNGKDFFQIINTNDDIDSLLKQRKILNPEEGVFSNKILIKRDTVMYGPFEYDLKDSNLTLNGSSAYQYMIGEYYTKDFENAFLTISNESHYKTEVTLLQSILLPSPNECKKKYDFISDEKLLEAFLTSLRAGAQYTKNEFNQIRDRLDEVLKSNVDIANSPDRRARVINLIKNESTDNQCTQDIIRCALEDTVLKQKISDFIVENNFAYVKELLLNHATTQQFLAEHKNNNSANLIQTCESKNNDLNSSNQIIEDDSNKIIKELIAENEALKNKITCEHSLDELKIEIDEYTEKRKEAKQKYDAQLIDNNELEKKFKETLEKFNNKATQTAKVLDKVLLDKIICGIDNQSNNIAPIVFDKASLCDDNLTANDIIDRVTRFITEKGHRNVTENDVANYLICITQGFITTFAGEPGTGKTSLCNLLAKSLGLCAAEPNTRYIDISVERGWSSHKDFIGYYNPLTKSIVKSNADVFNAFMTISKECDCAPEEIAPFLFLLDEANLSPIEHYWASFLRYCDLDSNTKRSISLGGNELINLPDHLRFLATVNFDHTTEELSPRFIDRSWIITLHPTRIDDTIDSQADNLAKTISYSDLKRAFGYSADQLIDETILKKWGTIQDIFKSNSLQIMPRNLMMVKKYCATACCCMNRATAASQFAPLDYAFSQKILPTINGTGDNYKKLVTDLLKECSMQFMPISNRHLERIEKSAINNLGFYQFFTR